MANGLMKILSDWVSRGLTPDPRPGDSMTWWQNATRNYRVDVDPDQFGPYVTCVNILSQDLARLPVNHIRVDKTTGKTIVTNSAASRVFRKPNTYQVKSDFVMYMMRSLLMNGNGYGYAQRNDRYEIDAIYPLNPRTVQPYIAEPTNDVFYQVGGDPNAELADIDAGIWVPQRDILHLRLQTPRHPLIGESPVEAAMPAIISGSEINAHNASFFGNMSRPSGVLTHPGRLEESAMKRIKSRWKELTTRAASGEPAVLSEGMAWTPLTMSAVDAELIASYNLTERQVAQIFRVPGFLLSDLEKATLTNVESLMRFYVMSSLGYYVNLVEENLKAFFRLPTNEFIRFDLESAMLRGDLESRLNALGKGVQNGIYSPNEARLREELPDVEYGDDVRVQQQLVPLSFGVQMEPTATPGQSPPATADETRGANVDAAYEKLMQAAL